MSKTTPFRRIDREKLVQHLDERMHNTDTYGLVARSIYEAIKIEVERGDFDLPDQERCVVCGRFTKIPHQHPTNGGTWPKLPVVPRAVDVIYVNTRADGDSAGVTGGPGLSS